MNVQIKERTNTDGTDPAQALAFGFKGKERGVADLHTAFDLSLPFHDSWWPLLRLSKRAGTTGPEE